FASTAATTVPRPRRAKRPQLKVCDSVRRTVCKDSNVALADIGTISLSFDSCALELALPTRRTGKTRIDMTPAPDFQVRGALDQNSCQPQIASRLCWSCVMLARNSRPA